MDYRFTALLIVMLTLLALFGGPAHSKNEYLNEYGVRCGEFEVRTDKRETDYNYSDSSTNEQQYLSFTFSFIVLQSTPKYFLYVKLKYCCSLVLLSE